MWLNLSLRHYAAVIYVHSAMVTPEKWQCSEVWQRYSSLAKELKNINIGFTQSQSVTLNMIADFSVVPQLSQINRNYRQTALAIGANLEGETTTEQARERIEKVLANIELPTGYKWTLDGSFSRQDEASRNANEYAISALHDIRCYGRAV